MPYKDLEKKRANKRKYSQSQARKNADKAYRIRNYKYIWAYKSTHSCIDCGESDPVVLDFHHRDPNTKKRSLAGMRSRSIEMIQKEIDKCDILCANCHRRRHAQEKM